MLRRSPITPRRRTIHHDPSPAYQYGFFLGDPTSDCVTVGTGNNFSGNLTISVSMYVAGSLCWGGSNVSMREPAGTGQTINLYVGKKFKVTGSNSSPVGTGQPSPAACGSGCIAQATVVGGCVDTRGQSVVCSLRGDPTKRSNQSGYGSGIYAAAYSSTQINIPPPTIDTAWYANARPGPATGCNDDPTHPADPAYMSTYPSGYTASTFKSALFDNNSTMSNPPSLGSVDFLTFGSFDCRYYNSSGELIGRLKWQSGSPGHSDDPRNGLDRRQPQLRGPGQRRRPRPRGRSTPPERSRSAARQTSASRRRRGIPASVTTTPTRTCSSSSPTTTAATAQPGSH